MKYLKPLDSFFINENIEQIDKYLKTLTFDELPLNFKKGLLTWMYEGEPVDWSINDPIKDWNNDENVKILINDYSREKGNVKYKFGFVPTYLVVEKIQNWIKEEGDYKSFNEYHKIFQSTNKVNHGDSLFPIIVSDNEQEYILDGWHRFHYYINKDLSKIPVIYC